MPIGAAGPAHLLRSSLDGRLVGVIDGLPLCPTAQVFLGDVPQGIPALHGVACGRLLAGGVPAGLGDGGGGRPLAVGLELDGLRTRCLVLLERDGDIHVPPVVLGVLYDVIVLQGYGEAGLIVAVSQHVEQEGFQPCLQAVQLIQVNLGRLKARGIQGKGVLRAGQQAGKGDFGQPSPLDDPGHVPIDEVNGLVLVGDLDRELFRGHWEEKTVQIKLIGAHQICTPSLTSIMASSRRFSKASTMPSKSSVLLMLLLLFISM